jgi:peptide/nickel transport system substrate-binding protein
LGIRPIDVAVRRALFASVIKRDELTGEWVGDLAEEWTVNEAGTGFEFTLREGLQWSDGTELSVEDVLFSIRELYLPVAQGPYAQRWANLFEISAERTGPRSFTLQAQNSHVDLYALAAVPPMPRHVFADVVEEEGAAGALEMWSVSEAQSVVSSGPFTIESFAPGGTVELVRNPGYHGRSENGDELPYLDGLSLRIVEEANLVDDLVSGRVDMIRVPHRNLSDLMAEHEDTVEGIYRTDFQPGVWFLTFNQNPVEGRGDAGVFEPRLTWFSDLRFRTAMAHLIDQDRIVEEILGGAGVPAHGFRAPESTYALQDASELAPEYDPDRALELLREMGFEDTNNDGILEDDDDAPINFTVLTNDSNRERVAIAEHFATEAGNIGVDVSVRAIPFDELVSRLMSGNRWDAAIMGFAGASEPWFPSHFLLSSGMLHFIEPGQNRPRREWEQEIDRLWQQSRETLNEQEQRELQGRIQEIWARELPFIYVPYGPDYIVSRVRIGNPIRQVYDWRVLPLEYLYRAE